MHFLGEQQTKSLPPLGSDSLLLGLLRGLQVRRAVVVALGGRWRRRWSELGAGAGFVPFDDAGAGTRDDLVDLVGGQGGGCGEAGLFAPGVGEAFGFVGALEVEGFVEGVKYGHVVDVSELL